MRVAVLVGVSVRMMMLFVFVMLVLVMVMMMPVLVVRMVMSFRQVNVEFDAFDAPFLPARRMQMIASQCQLPQFPFQLFEIHSQIEQRAEEHVPTQAAD